MKDIIKIGCGIALGMSMFWIFTLILTLIFFEKLLNSPLMFNLFP